MQMRSMPLMMKFQFAMNLYLVFGILSGVNCATRTRTFTTIADRRCTNVTQHFRVSSHVACCRACMRDSGCTALNYRPVQGRCELSHTVSDVTEAPGWNFWRAGAACPPGWAMFGNTCLYLDDTPRSHAEAQAYCTGLVPSAHLLDVKTQPKWAMIEAWLLEQPLGIDPGVWLGGNLNVSTGNFEWTDSQPLSAGFEHWQLGEPNMPTTEQCLGALSLGDLYWFDVPCDGSYPVLGACEYSIV